MARLVYKLTGQKKSDESEKGYYAEGISNGKKMPFKPLPVSRSLPRYFRIVEKDKTGRNTIRQIAYAPSENTIYVDEFIDPKAKIKKVKFTKGFLRVDDEAEPMLPKFLEKVPFNLNNPNRKPSDPVKFMRLDNEAKANEILEQEETIAKELDVFWELPMEMRRAIANSVGINTQRPYSLWAIELFNWAKLNTKTFRDKYHDPEIEYIDLMSRAEAYNILTWGEFTWKYGGVPILKVSKGRNRYMELTTKLINEPQLENAIRNEVAAKEGKSARTIGEQQEEIDFSEINSSALLKLAKERGVVKYITGVGHELIATGNQFGEKSVKSAEQEIDNNEILREQIIAQIGKS